MISHPFSLIIPVYNEAKSLPRFLKSLDEMIEVPAEILFIDGGSQDQGGPLIQNWALKRPEISIRYLEYRSLYPGAARNRGVEEAKFDVVAFLDVGVFPDPYWAHHMWRELTQNNLQGVFGNCFFYAETSFQRALCALSNGFKNRDTVLPCSIFKKEVFKTIGYFPEKLRSAEDILWRRRFLRWFQGEYTTCPYATVYYDQYPSNILRIVKKYYKYSVCSVLAGVMNKRVLLYLSFFSTLALLSFLSPLLAVFTFSLYLVYRGIYIPYSRSLENFFWWKDKPLSFLFCLFLAPLIDLSKYFGFLAGMHKKIFRGEEDVSLTWRKKGNKLRILHVITTIELGGAENHLVDLIKGQIDEGHRVGVAYLKGEPYWKEALEGIGVEVFNMKLPFYGSILPILRLRQTFRRFYPDLIHAHMPPAELYARLALVFFGRETELYITKHNDEPFAPVPFYKLLARWVAQRARRILTISDAVKNYTEDIVSNRPVDTVYYGINAYRFASIDPKEVFELKKEWNIAEGDLIIGTVARLVRQKSLDTLICGFNLFQKRNKKNSKLVIVGSGELEGKLKKLTKELGLDDKVIWAGKRSDIETCMNAFDIFVLPSIYEGFGLVLLEAMAAKVPVVATKVSAIPETVLDGETGLLITPRNELELSDAFCQLEGEAIRSSMGEVAFRRVTQNYSIQKMVDKTLTIYQT